MTASNSEPIFENECKITDIYKTVVKKEDGEVPVTTQRFFNVGKNQFKAIYDFFPGGIESIRDFGVTGHLYKWTNVGWEKIMKTGEKSIRLPEPKYGNRYSYVKKWRTAKMAQIDLNIDMYQIARKFSDVCFE